MLNARSAPTFVQEVPLASQYWIGAPNEAATSRTQQSDYPRAKQPDSARYRHGGNIAGGNCPYVRNVGLKVADLITTRDIEVPCIHTTRGIFRTRPIRRVLSYFVSEIAGVWNSEPGGATQFVIKQIAELSTGLVVTRMWITSSRW